MVIEIRSPGEPRPPIEMFEVTDPREIAEARHQREQFDRNSQWLQKHMSEVCAPENRGKIVCIAGQEAFFGDDVREVVGRATAAHPDDKGWFTQYLRRDNWVMIYAHQR